MTGYSLSLLPTGPELLQREEREVDQVDHIVQLSEKRSEFKELTLPSTQSSLEEYQYESDELHQGHSKFVSLYEVCFPSIVSFSNLLERANSARFGISRQVSSGSFIRQCTRGSETRCGLRRSSPLRQQSASRPHSASLLSGHAGFLARYAPYIHKAQDRGAEQYCFIHLMPRYE